jgi:hypothetical protein
VNAVIDAILSNAGVALQARRGICQYFIDKADSARRLDFLRALLNDSRGRSNFLGIDRQMQH